MCFDVFFIKISDIFFEEQIVVFSVFCLFVFGIIIEASLDYVYVVKEFDWVKCIIAYINVKWITADFYRFLKTLMRKILIPNTSCVNENNNYN